MANRVGRSGLRALALEAGMIAMALVFAFPLYMLFSLALKPQREWTTNPFGLPETFYLGNITEAWVEAELGRAMASSVLILVCSIAILVVIGAPAAYWIARRFDRLGHAMYLLFIAGMVLPFQLALIPLYQLMRDTGLLGSPLSLIVFFSGLKLPLTIFLYAGYIRGLPRSYEEAARMDGASQFQVFYLVVLPMLRPITATVVILNGVFIWNDFLTPLLYLQNSGWETLTVSIYSFAGQESSNLGLVFGGLVAAIAPIMIVFLLLQKYMMEGFSGGLKG
jgi:raffinose/stachyose/melibiose transport system permease protein